MADARRFVMAIDEGTTGTRATLFDAGGQPVASGYHEFAQHYPNPGWVEHDAEEIWAKTHQAMRDALEGARAEARDVAAIGITNQRETVVAWDAKTGNALARAIVWQDRRTSDQMARWKQTVGEAWVRRKTGLRLDPYFSGSKIHWLLRHDARVQRARKEGRLRFGTMDAWVIHKLTAGTTFATDPSNASRTLLMDLRRGDFDDELLKTFGPRREELPEIRDSSGPIASTAREILGVEIPIAGVAGDQQAALFGQACFRPGMAKNTYGTGCFALVNAGTKPVAAKGGLLASAAWRIKGKTTYALEGAVFVAGAAVQWLRDELKIVGDAAETEGLAQSVADTGDVYLVPAFVGLGAPYWDPYARGALIGLTRGTGRAQIARAALESISFQSAEIVALLAKHSGHKVPRLRVDGGAAANNFLMQHQADVLGVPVERPVVQETTALGAAYLAGLGVGFWSSEKELEGHWKLERRFTPSQSSSWRSKHLARWREAVQRSLAWAR